MIVMLRNITLDEYRDSIRKGSFFSIHDWGKGVENKGRYPTVASIVVSDRAIHIDTDGEVAWIADGKKVAESNTLDLDTLSHNTVHGYIRAEISNLYGRVFTQPWTLAWE
jgi:hypothetical protein